MAQNTKNQRGKNLIIIPQRSDQGSDYDLPNFYSRNPSITSDFYNLENANFGRQSSITGNLFKTFQTSEKPREEPIKTVEEPKITDAQRYAQQCLVYEKYQFDDRIKLIIHRMAIKAYQNFKDKTEHKFLSFSIQKLLGIIAKKLLLNRFELLFLQYVFEETKWKFDIQCISRHAPEYISYAHSSDGEGVGDTSKQLQIYFLYCSFYSKKSLNELPSDGKSNKGHKFNGLTGYLKSLSKKFNLYFQQWTQQSNVSNIKINPRILNSIFKRLTYYSDREPEDIQNYCLLVQQILQISPAYNAQKGSKKRKTNKMKKQQDAIQEEKEVQEDLPIHHDQQSPNLLGEMNELQNKKNTSYLSNVDGLSPMRYINNQRQM